MKSLRIILVFLIHIETANMAGYALSSIMEPANLFKMSVMLDTGRCLFKQCHFR